MIYITRMYSHKKEAIMLDKIIGITQGDQGAVVHLTTGGEFHTRETLEQLYKTINQKHAKRAKQTQ